MEARSLTQRLGGTWRNGRGQAPCPCCQTERRRDQVALSISQAGDKLLLWCFKNGCSFVEIANAAGAELVRAQIDFVTQAKHVQTQSEYQAAQLAKARSLWYAAKPIAGTKAEVYLRARGIKCDLPSSLRFMPDIFHGPSKSSCMAMVADVSSGGVHRTYFDRQGDRLPNNAKMMLGPCAGGAVRLSKGDRTHVVCEGLETGLSLLSGFLRGPASVWAALSTSGMKTLRLPSKPRELIIATDGDGPGREAGDKLAHRASRLGWCVSLMPAPDDQDWNDVLRERKEQ